MANFARCLAVVLACEGGFVDDAGDPGGATNLGITLATLSRWRGRVCTVDDVRVLSRDEAQAIYRADFWAPIGGDGLPLGVDLITFDAAVNQGPGLAVKLLQAAVGAPADGVVGPKTLVAVDSLGAEPTIRAMRERRLAAYRAAAGWTRFGRGWTARLERVAAEAAAWAKAA